MGPMSLRVASYFPFNVTCYLNGHSFVAQELTRAGVRFRKDDNAFLGVADVAALQAAADRLSAAVVQRRCAYWGPRSAQLSARHWGLAIATAWLRWSWPPISSSNALRR